MEGIWAIFMLLVSSRHSGPPFKAFRTSSTAINAVAARAIAGSIQTSPDFFTELGGAMVVSSIACRGGVVCCELEVNGVGAVTQGEFEQLGICRWPVQEKVPS